MRHTISLSLLLLLLGSMHAQITIDRADFPRENTFSDTLIISPPNNSPLPAQGANQLWDYSGLPSAPLTITPHFDARNDPNFPGATSYFPQERLFDDFEIPTNNYQGLDADGLYDVGFQVLGTQFPLTTITGNSSDIMSFPVANQEVTGRYDRMQFPCTYEKKWSANVKDEIDFNLTVGAFGLSNTPALLRRILTYTREVVGYGKLIIPTRNGSPSAPIDVLLIREDVIQTDSFFLAGMPAPAALLGEFGVIQGQTNTDQAYYFYRAGFDVPVMRVGVASVTSPNSFSYRPAGTDGITTSLENEFERNAVPLFPNPATQGQSIQLQSDQQLGQGSIKIVDIQGREVEVIRVQAKGQNYYEGILPSSLPTGTYFYFVQNQQGERKGQGKLLIQ